MNNTMSEELTLEEIQLKPQEKENPVARAQRRVDDLIATNNLTVPTKLRSQLRPLGFLAFHKTLVDQFGNFTALITDGCIVWCKIATGEVVLMHLKNIKRIRIRQKNNLRSPGTGAKRPTKTQQKVLEWFKQFEEEEE